MNPTLTLERAYVVNLLSQLMDIIVTLAKTM